MRARTFAHRYPMLPEMRATDDEPRPGHRPHLPRQLSLLACGETSAVALTEAHAEVFARMAKSKASHSRADG